MSSVLIPIRYGEVLVSEEDAALVHAHPWRVDSLGYAVRTVSKGVFEYLHRAVNRTPDGLVTDHINGKRLDNRRENLRSVTFAENLRNRSKNSNNKSGYKGVSWNTKSKKWLAYITLNGKTTYLGGFENRLDAARAYERASPLYHGKMARPQTIKDIFA